ncbi:hypothetical protein D3H65_17200 [Paraflavitalea soli]|uniref:Histidine kinase domain-containing protein n=1 Tax=Paraflavitalea soli TaxID=2315862 RepID=A0A3B7MRK5_9BACT|nr:ATP-binding protein [Paraflavitalea soli]AXY75606.1 hypothetical protein D3H65_17200 [Paraflavitalea soli]
MRSLPWHGLFATLYLFLLCPGRLSARQQPLPSFDTHHCTHYDDEQGLPSNDITGFFEDHQGYLWFTTQFGLVRFDGREFRTWYTGNVPTLTFNRLYSLNGRSTDSLFFSDESKAVHMIDAAGQVKPMPGLRAGQNFLMSQHSFILDLRPYFRKAEDSVRIMKVLTDPEYLHAMHEFYPDTNGNAWFLSRKHLSYFQQGHFLPVDAYDVEREAHFRIKKSLFTVNPAGMITLYEAGKRSAATFFLKTLLPALKGDKQPDLHQLKFSSNPTGTFLQYQRQLWALSFDGQNLHSSLLLHDLRIPLSTEAYYSQRHRLYIFRTMTNGFYLVREQPFTVRSFLDKEGIQNNFTAAVEIQPMQVLTTNGVIFSKDTAFRRYPLDYVGSNALLKDKDQHIWILLKDTLFCMDNRLQPLNYWVVPYTDLASILQDSKGTIWYCTSNSLARIDNGEMRFVYRDNKALRRTQCLFMLNDTSFWLGTTIGLFTYNLQRNTITPHREMRGVYVRHVYRATDGTIWIGTYGQGFYTWRNGHFIAMPQDKNHYLATAHCFMEDSSGFFWIPTNKGLFQVARSALEGWLSNKEQEVYYHYYNKFDGFASNEFNGGSSPVGIRLQNGTFSLPSMKGMVWFRPQQVKPAMPMAKIQVDRVALDTQEIKFTGPIRLPAGSHRFRFHISSPFFGNTANFVPEFKVKGVDQSWTPVAADNSIPINYLSPGKYTLEIRLRNGFGPGAYTTQEQSFSIAPYIYQTLVFKLAATLIALALIAVVISRYHKNRIRDEQERAQILEQQVADRTQVLKRTVTELKELEENLHKSNLLKDRLTTIILHDIRSPLRFMNMLCNQLNGALAAGDTQALAAMTAELKKSSDQLDVFTREFLVWLTTQQTGFKLRKEYIDIFQLFREAKEFYRNVLSGNNNTLEIEGKEDISAWTDRQLLKIILHNLIDNANKHTDNGTIRLSVTAIDKDQVSIKVADSGRGMTTSELHTLQKGLEDESSLGVTDGAGNLGYRIIRDFIARLNGHIIVESALETGTTVTILLPIL